MGANASTCAHRCGGHRVCACGGRGPPCFCHGRFRHRGSAIDDAGHACSDCHRVRGRGGRGPCCACPCCASDDDDRPACQHNCARAIGSENVEHCGGPLQPARPCPPLSSPGRGRRRRGGSQTGGSFKLLWAEFSLSSSHRTMGIVATRSLATALVLLAVCLGVAPIARVCARVTASSRSACCVCTRLHKPSRAAVTCLDRGGRRG